MSSCNVCTETYNKSTRIVVVCNFCDFEVCRICCEKYVLTSDSPIGCMSCKNEWDEQDINNKFSAKFINNYHKTHRVNVLFEKEKKLFPATQPLVEEILRKREFDKQLKEYESEILAVNRKISILIENYHRETDKNQKQRFTIRRCVRISCRGYLNNDWSCGLCETRCCSDCFFEMDSTHVCKPENIETARLLEKDSKPCPNCSSVIFKIEGCDQMYCTQCKTPFSWNTGKIENGTIHNPHHFEELRRAGNIDRNPLEVRCGREIDNHFINGLRKFQESLSFYYNDHALSIFMSMATNLVRIRRIDLQKYVNVTNDNSDLRIRYLMSEISDEQFKFILQKRDKENRKSKKLTTILNMYIDCSTEIFYRIINHAKDKNFNSNTTYFNPLLEFQSLIDYTNKCLEDVTRLYKCKSYIIEDDGFFTRA